MVSLATIQLNEISAKSRTLTVVRECCKGDDASQWENGKFVSFPLATPEPLNRSSFVTKCCTRDYVLDIYRQAKFSHDPSRGFFSSYAEIGHQNVYLASFFRVLPTAYSLCPWLNRFSRLIRQTTRFRARMCLFGVRKQKFNIHTP